MNKSNKLIALMSKYCRLIENYGFGLVHLIRNCVYQSIQAHLFEESYKDFKVTLYKVITLERKTSTRQKICKQITGNKQITRIELTKLGRGSETAIVQQMAR